MTIECYFSDCPKHSIHDYPDDGPFCYEMECVAIPAKIEEYRKKRLDGVLRRGELLSKQERDET